MDGTGVKPGLIGEIGVAQGWISPLEERVHRAVARTQVRTGLPLSTHTIYRDAGLGLSWTFLPRRASICPGSASGTATVSRTSTTAWPSSGGEPTSHSTISAPRWVASRSGSRGSSLSSRDRGHQAQILLSARRWTDSELRFFGGRGFTYLTECLCRELRAAGASEDLIRTLTVTNPQKFLSVP